MKTDAAWKNACAAIEARDPHARGIVVLGLDAPADELEQSFAVAARHPLVKGFAVGRTIFADRLPRNGWRARSRTAKLSPKWRATIRSLCKAWDTARSGERKDRMTTMRLTAAQALVRYASAQLNEDGVPFLAGCWAIFGHGNVAGLGEALHGARDVLPTWRGHNEQSMAHAAIAYAKQLGRRRAMMVTSSIGPGATNMVTAAALAHVNRLPVLLVPGDVFANRAPDPVLQQLEDFGDGVVTVNDCFRPVSRYFDRIMRPGAIAYRPAPRLPHHDRSGRLRAGDARLLPGRAGRGVRLAGRILRAEGLAAAPARTGCARTGRRGQGHQGGEEPGHRRRRRRALFRRDCTR